MKFRNERIVENTSLDEKRINRLKLLSSPLISDVMNKPQQFISGLSPLEFGMKICGIAFTALYTDQHDSTPGLFQHNRYLLIETSARLAEGNQHEIDEEPRYFIKARL